MSEFSAAVEKQVPRLRTECQAWKVGRDFRVSQLLAPDNSRCAQRTADALSQSTGKLKIQKAFHLLREAFAVTVPPDFFHPRHEVHIQIFQSHHFFHAETSVSPADAARFPAA